MRTLFMSGFTADIMSEHGSLDTNLEFIAKPFTAGQLASRVAEILARPT